MAIIDLNNCEYCNNINRVNHNPEGGNMTRKANVSPVLLSNSQIAALREIQEKERQNSPLGIAPGIHAIARMLIDRALSAEAAGVAHG